MPEKIIILGGGWCGVRLALRNPDRYIVTNRSEEKVKSSKVLSVLFDVERTETWENLLQLQTREDIIITGVVITFALSSDLATKCIECIIGLNFIRYLK